MTRRWWLRSVLTGALVLSSPAVQDLLFELAVLTEGIDCCDEDVSCGDSCAQHCTCGIAQAHPLLTADTVALVPPHPTGPCRRAPAAPISRGWPEPPLRPPVLEG